MRPGEQHSTANTQRSLTGRIGPIPRMAFRFLCSESEDLSTGIGRTGNQQTYRRLVVAHGFISFVFNVAIVALMVNISSEFLK